jgi:uncharacterized membrane protein YoaK (UPF0700 family)
MTKLLTALRELAHFLLPVGGLIAGSAGAISLFVSEHAPVTQTATMSVLTGIGYATTLLSKFVDSRSFTDIQTAAVALQSGNVQAAGVAVDKAVADSGLPSTTQGPLAPPSA